MNTTIETTAKPNAAANSFGVPVAIAWRNFFEVLSGVVSGLFAGHYRDACAMLTIAASHAESLGLDARELDNLNNDLAYAEDVARKVERAIADLHARTQADWPQTDRAGATLN
jgi:hypothetical protein